MNKKKVISVLKQILKCIDGAALTQDEAVLLYGNLGYSLGTSISGQSKHPPTLEELEISYLTQPSVANFLSLTGLNICMRTHSGESAVTETSNRGEEIEKEKS